MDELALEPLARYFRALSEPIRLRILDALRTQPMNVGELTALLGCSQANVSKHLALLAETGLVEREPRGTAAYYRFTDPEVYALCDLVCGQVARRLAGDAKLRRVLDQMAGRNKPAR